MTCASYNARYLWSYGPCGVSQSALISKMTLGCVPTLLLSESFETINQTPPANWAVDAVAGSNAIWFINPGTSPSCYPYNLIRMVEFRSYTYVTGTQNRLKYLLPISVSGYSDIAIDFTWMVDPEFSSNQDRVEVQYSTDGSTWNTVTTLYRYGPSKRWVNENISLFPGLSPYSQIYIALLFTSAYGNNCHLDFLHVTGY